MTRQHLILMIVVFVLLAGCGGGETPVGDVIPETGSDKPASPVPLPTKMNRPTATVTSTPLPTETPVPTNTPQPTPTVAPTWVPFTVGDVEAAFRADGYGRYPISDEGLQGFTWVKGNPYERVETWEDGTIELQVLHDESPGVRTAQMERKFAVLDNVLPAEFMVELRALHEEYNHSVGDAVTGEPDSMEAFGGVWQTVVGEYNASERKIRGYTIRFSLWWWQVTCPPQALFCYYENFPGLEFRGDSSFIFYTILIYPSGGGNGPNAW